ncbi:MAG: nodulation protein NfeD, partial [Candidatus Methanofastidiosia archaeon]
PVPVIIYVSPQGAIAASAGTYIAMGSHLVAMAPSTSIGACQPILGYDPMTGQIMEAGEKTEKFYTSYMRSLAEAHERNPEIAAKFVSENLSLTPQEALEDGMVDVVADDVEDLLEKANGLRVRGKLLGKEHTLRIRNAEIREIEISFTQKFLSYITNPNIAYLLMIIGIYGLIFGFMTPGWHVPETLGAICIVLAIIANGYIGWNIGGVILILMGIAFFIIEIKTTTFGLFTAAGLACFILGSLILYQSGAGEGEMERLVTREWYESFRLMVLGVSIVSAGFFIFAVTKALKLRRTKPKTGWDELIGMKGVVIEDLEPEGKIKVRGEIWKARSDTKLNKGESVEVIDKKGFVLIVRGGE